MTVSFLMNAFELRPWWSCYCYSSSVNCKDSKNVQKKNFFSFSFRVWKRFQLLLLFRRNRLWEKLAMPGMSSFAFFNMDYLDTGRHVALSFKKNSRKNNNVACKPELHYFNIFLSIICTIILLLYPFLREREIESHSHRHRILILIYTTYHLVVLTPLPPSKQFTIKPSKKCLYYLMMLKLVQRS